MPAYRITRSRAFEVDMESIGPKDDRLDEVMRALEDASSRNPLVGQQLRVNGDGVRMLVGHPRRAMPIRFYYVYDGGSTITLIGARQYRM